MRLVQLKLLLALIGIGGNAWPFDGNYFQPAHRLTAIGVDRSQMSSLDLESRTQRMIDSQTFTILREPEALLGAQRSRVPSCKSCSSPAAAKAAFRREHSPPSLISRVFGNPKAESPAGPKGIMQFSEATARSSGLRVVHTTRYHTSVSVQEVRNKHGKLVKRKVKTKIPYVVTSRDDRFSPSAPFLPPPITSRVSPTATDARIGLSWHTIAARAARRSCSRSRKKW